MYLRTFSNHSEEGKAFVESSYKAGFFHSGSNTIIGICTSGYATLVTDSDVFTIHEGMAIFVGDYPYRIENRSEDYAITICVQSKKALQNLYDTETLYQFNQLIYHPRLFYINTAETMFCSYSLFRASAAANDPDNAYGKEIAACYIKIVLLQILNILDHEPHMREVKAKRENYLADKYIRLVSEHHVKHRKVKDYADMMNISPKYLSSVILSATGRHATAWIDDATIREIKNRLKNTDDSIQKISFDLDFSTPSHLSKYFGDKVGLTPLAYRTMKRKMMKHAGEGL